jgi:hypothetical protein
VSDDALREALRPIVAELVEEEVEQRLAEHAPSEDPPNLTVAQYAVRHHATPAAIRARCRRHRIPGAFKPPGAREWLILNERPGGHGATLSAPDKCPRDAGTSGGVTPQHRRL